MQSIEVRLNEALDAVKQRDELIRSLKRVIHRKSLIISSHERDAKCKQAGLPMSAIKRLHEAFAQSVDNAGLREAIKVEKEQHGQRN
jgi:hypothetical protein